MKKYFFTLVITFLALGYLAPFSVSAQSGNNQVTPLCFFKAVQGDPYVQYAKKSTVDGTSVCPSPETSFEKITPSVGLDTGVVGVCWKREGTAPSFIYTVKVSKAADASGRPTDCPADLSNFIPRSTFRAANATTPTPTPGQTPPIITPPGGGTTDPNNTNTGTQIADCSDPGFHAVGPLCLPNSPFANNNSIANTGSVTDLAVKVIRVLLFIAGIVAVVMIIIGGYLYMTARGNDLQAMSGRKTLTNAVIGLAIIILSYVIVQAIYSFLVN